MLGHIRMSTRGGNRLGDPDEPAEFLLPKGIVARWSHHRKSTPFQRFSDQFR